MPLYNKPLIYRLVVFRLQRIGEELNGPLSSLLTVIKTVLLGLSGSVNTSGSSRSTSYSVHQLYGIFAGTQIVSTNALLRACFVTKFLFADRPEFADSFYDKFGRILIMDTNTAVKDVPEYKKYITPAYANMKTGLSAIKVAPVSTVTEESASCFFEEDGVDDVFRV